MSLKRLILTFFVSILFVGILIIAKQYSVYKSIVVKVDSTTEIEDYLLAIRNQSGKITIHDYLDYDVDGFYIIGPYTPSVLREELVKKKWTIEDTMLDYYFVEWAFSGDNLSEEDQILLFIKNKSPNAYAKLIRSHSDFVFSEKNYYRADEILFNEVGDNGSNYWKIKLE